MRSAASSGGTGSSNGRETATIGAAGTPALRSLPVAFGQGDGGRTRRARRRRRCRAGRGGRIAVALGRGRGCGRLAGIARPALAVNRAGGSDRSGQQLRGVAAAGAEIERDDTGTNADEAQHLLRLAAQIVGTIGRAAIGARHDLRNLLGRKRAANSAAPSPRGAPRNNPMPMATAARRLLRPILIGFPLPLGPRRPLLQGRHRRRARSARECIGIRRQIHVPNLARQSHLFHRRTKVSRDGLQCSFDDAWLTARFQAVYRAGPHWYGPPRRGRGWPFCRFRSTT